MATVIVFEFGMFVAMGAVGTMAGVPDGNAPPACGLGISTGAMKTDVGVACTVLLEAQLEINSAHRNRMKKC